MKVLSVVVTCVLLLTANRMAVGLKRVGALPATRTSEVKVSPTQFSASANPDRQSPLNASKQN